MTHDVTALLPPWFEKLTPYEAGKPIDELEREYGVRDTIKLASNENPLGPSPRAVEAVRRALEGVHRYPDGSAFYLTRRLAQQFELRPEQFVVGNGSNELIELVVRAFVRPGDEVVMADQAFVIYRMVVQAAAGIPRLVPLKRFTHDLEAMAAAVTPRTRAVFVANPNNPTGTIYTRAAWERFLDALPRNVVVVADDAYAEYVDDPEYPSSVDYLRDGRLLVTLRTMSKIYGLAGLRLGYGISQPDVIAALNRIRQPFNVNSLAQVAALAALDDTQHVRRTQEVTRAGMTYLRAACERLGLSVVPSWANFILVAVGDGEAVYEALLRQGMIVRPMSMYRFPAHIRVTVGTAAENERFVTAIEGVLARGAATAASPAPGRGSTSSGERRAAGGSQRAPAAETRPRPALFDRMAVIGVGLIGGSLALAARERALVRHVIGCARSEDTLRVAKGRGLVDEATRDPATAVREADLVVLAVPVGVMRDVAAAVVRNARPGTVVTDVGSVKKEVLERVAPLCQEAGCRFVGGHPVAGREGGGPAAADGALFRGHRCILTPTTLTEADALARVRALWEGVGMHVEEMDADTHDRILARVSHAPHLIAYALASAVGEARAGERAVAAYAGSGFRDTTRIAASAAELWSDIALANRDQVLEALREFGTRLRMLEDLLGRRDAPALEEALAGASRHRRAIGPGSADPWPR